MLNRGWAPLSGVLADRDKFIDLPIAERYDLAADPAERVNLSGRAAERDRTLAASLRAFNAAPPGERRAEDPEAAARLRALGYVSGSAPAEGAIHGGRRSEAARRSRSRGARRGRGGRRAPFRRGGADLSERVIARRPDMAIAYRHLAFVEWQRGNPRRAIDTLQRALKRGVTAAARSSRSWAAISPTPAVSPRRFACSSRSRTTRRRTPRR